MCGRTHKREVFRIRYMLLLRCPTSMHNLYLFLLSVSTVTSLFSRPHSLAGSAFFLSFLLLVNGFNSENSAAICLVSLFVVRPCVDCDEFISRPLFFLCVLVSL